MRARRSLCWLAALAPLVGACAPPPVSPDTPAADGPPAPGEPPARASAPAADLPVGRRRSGPALPPAPAPPRPAGDPTLPVAVQPGDAEFHGGDGIELIEVRGTAPRLQVGDLYEVRGRYRLRSRPRATLLLSVTTGGPGGKGPVAPDSRQALTQGEGEFTLRVVVADEGYPHVTFYDERGQPFGGLYFGHDGWRLERKSWRYQASTTP